MEARLHIDAEPALTLTQEQLTRSHLAPTEQVRLLIAPGRVAALVGGAPFFAGSLATLSSGEVLAQIYSGLRSGALHVRSALGTVELHFREGEVIAGSASNPRLRLGKVLLANGWIDAATLAELEPLVHPGRRLGRLLTERSLLRPADLYRAVVLQVEEMALEVLSWEEGEYLFVEGTPPPSSPLKLSRRTRELCVEGGRLQQELERLRQRLPLEARVKAHQPLEKRASWLGEAAQAHVRVRELAPRWRLRELEALREVAAAIELRQIELVLPEHPEDDEPRPSKPPARRRATTMEIQAIAGAVTTEVAAGGPGSSGRSALETYRKIFRHIFAVLKRETNTAQEGLNSFFLGLPEPYAALFDGLTLSADGDLPVDQILARAEASAPGANGRDIALEALENLMAFALFEARNALPGEAAEQLLHEVGLLQIRSEP
jgi:hypothetical protein